MQGVRVLSRRNLESYLFDDEVLKALAVDEWTGSGQGSRRFSMMKEGASLPRERTVHSITSNRRAERFTPHARKYWA